MGGKWHSRVAWFHSRCTWLDNGPVPLKLVQDMVAESSWWLAQGIYRLPVQAPGSADNVTRGNYGWELPLGSNRFAAEFLVKLVRPVLQRAFATMEAGESIDRHAILEQIARMCEQSVLNANGERYRSYPRQDGYMVFGTHAINTVAVANHVFHAFGIPACLSKGSTTEAARKSTERRSRQSLKPGRPSAENDGKGGKGLNPSETGREAKGRESKKRTKHREDHVIGMLRKLRRAYPKARHQAHSTFLREALERIYEIEQSKQIGSKQKEELRLLKAAIYTRIA